MSKKSTPSSRRPANLSSLQIRQALPKLRRRVEELRNFDIGNLKEDTYESDLRALKDKVNATLSEIYGYDTIEYTRFASHGFYEIKINLSARQEPLSHKLPEIIKRRESTIKQLETVIDILNERLIDFNEVVDSEILRAYEGLDLHYEVSRAASDLYRNAHYANAVEASVKALNNLVRLRSGESLDGTSLMQKVFSSKSPLLRFNSYRISLIWTSSKASNIFLRALSWGSATPGLMAL